MSKKGKKSVMSFPWGEVRDLQETERRGIVFDGWLRVCNDMQVEAVRNDMEVVVRQEAAPFFRNKR